MSRSLFVWKPKPLHAYAARSLAYVQPPFDVIAFRSRSISARQVFAELWSHTVTSTRFSFSILSGVVALLLALAPQSADAQTLRTNGTVAHPGFTLVNDPGMWAMGRGGVALRGRPGAVDMNPAVIGQDGIVQGGVDLGSDPLLATDHFFTSYERSPFVTVKSGRWATAAQVNVFRSGEVERRDDQGRTLDTVNPIHFSAKVFGAYDLSDVWTIGGAIGYSRDETVFPSLLVDDAALSSLVIDLGAYGEWEHAAGENTVLRPAVGASLVNFGANSQETTQSLDGSFSDPVIPGVGPFASGIEYPTPTTLRLGGALTLEDGETWNGRTPFSATAHVGLSKQLVSIERQVAEPGRDVSGSFAALIDAWRPERRIEINSSGEEVIVEANAWQQVEKHLGLEVSAYEIVDLRIGRNQVGENTGFSSYTTFGVGVDLVYVRLDYAGTLSSRSETLDDRSAFRVTAMIPLNGSYENNWLAEVF